MAIEANPVAARTAAYALAERSLAQHSAANSGAAKAPAPTARQLKLTQLWKHYRCQTYDGRKTAWDGSAYQDAIASEAIASAPFIPPGFTDVGSATATLRFRRPTAPYYLCHLIVLRFTGLLFSQRRHPKVNIEGDEDSEDALEAALRAGRFWSTMMKARTLGGGMGSVAISFSLRNGKPTFQAHDARWCTPIFSDRHNGTLTALEIRYCYESTDASGRPVWCWYRRVIDSTSDTTWMDVPCANSDGDMEEPDWVLTPASESIVHNWGFTPARWIQNLPVEEDLDGDPDCFGAYDMMLELDALVAEADRGVLSNCDPTLLVATDAELGEVRKGSDNALKLLRGDNAQYLELNGSGPEAGYKAADRLEARILRLTQCTLDSQTATVSKTATEVVTDQAAMWSKADILREQYGETGVRPLLVDFLRACQLELKRRRPVILSPRPRRNEEGVVVGYEPRRFGESTDVQLQWFEYQEPSLDDVSRAVKAAADAKREGLVDREHAARFVSKHFSVEDVGAMLAKMSSEDQTALRDEYTAMVASRATAPSKPAPTASPVEDLTDVTEMDGEEQADAELETAPTTTAANLAAMEDVDVAATALNGAQMKGLQDILASVTDGKIHVDSAEVLIRISVPAVSLKAIEALLLPYRTGMMRTAAIAPAKVG